MEPGELVQIKDDRSRRLAVVLETGRKVHVLDGEGRKLVLPPSQVEVTTARNMGGREASEALLERLRAAEVRVREMAGHVDVESLWDLLVEEAPQGLPLEDIAELIFEDKNDWAVPLALFRALAENSLYFRRKKDLWQPKERHVVEESSRQGEERYRREEELQRFVEWLRRGLRAGGEVPAEHEGYMRLLFGLAVFGDDFEGRNQAVELLSRLSFFKGRPGPEMAFDLLVAMGRFSPDENVALLRHRIKVDFSSEALKEAERLALSPQPDGTREDLREIPVFTIDDHLTRDIDDALSLEEVDGHYLVGIHIADVSAFVRVDSLLDNVAFSRGTSLYCPDARYPMLPPRLSEDTASLVPNEDRVAVSFLVEISPEGQILSERVAPSLIRSRHRLTYEDVDGLFGGASPMDGDPTWRISRLWELAQLLEKERLARGAIVLRKNEVLIHVGPDRKVNLRSIDVSSPGHRLVQEMMILANQVAARFCQSRGIPCIYRLQASPESTLPTDQDIPEGPALAFEIRRRMKPGELSTQPGPHAGLGVAIYSQATSPIRRYQDLVVHHQIRAVLAGEQPPWSREDVLTRAATAGIAAREASAVERERREYWLLTYLRGQLGQAVAATIVALHGPRAVIELEETMVTTSVSAPSNARLGDRVMVRIEAVNARRLTLVVSLMGLAQPSGSEQ